MSDFELKLLVDEVEVSSINISQTIEPFSSADCIPSGAGLLYY